MVQPTATLPAAIKQRLDANTLVYACITALSHAVTIGDRNAVDTARRALSDALDAWQRLPAA